MDLRNTLPDPFTLKDLFAAQQKAPNDDEMVLTEPQKRHLYTLLQLQPKAVFSEADVPPQGSYQFRGVSIKTAP